MCNTYMYILHICTYEEKQKSKEDKTKDKVLEPQAKIQHKNLPKEWRTKNNHPLDNIIGEIPKGVTSKHSLRHAYSNMAFVSQVVPKSIADAIEDKYWMISMQEELNQFERNQVW